MWNWKKYALRYWKKWKQIMKEVKIHKVKIEKLDSDMAMLQKQIDELRKLSIKSRWKWRTWAVWQWIMTPNRWSACREMWNEWGCTQKSYFNVRGSWLRHPGCCHIILEINMETIRKMLNIKHHFCVSLLSVIKRYFFV